MKKLRLLGKLLRVTGADRIILGFLGYVLGCGLLIWPCEPGIHTYGEALWYCFAAVSTIGFGDVVVHTALSRALTVLLSVYAVATLAIFTAVVVNFFQKVIAQDRQEALMDFLQKVARLPDLSREEMEALARKARKWV